MEFFEHFMELMTDPAHLAFEVATSIIFALLAQLAAWPVIARRIRREHATIDAEHGIVDHNEHFEPKPADPRYVTPDWGQPSYVQHRQAQEQMLLGHDGHRCHAPGGNDHIHSIVCPTGEHMGGWQHMAGGEHRSMFPCCLSDPSSLRWTITRPPMFDASYPDGS